MNLLKTLSAIIITTVFVSNTAMAEGGKLSEKLSNVAIEVNIEINSCNADAAKLCPGLPLNSKKSFMCLMAYEDNLSTDCILGMAESAVSLHEGMIAIKHSIQKCEADADKYCLDVAAGEGRIVSCLKKNKLKKECTKALKDTGLWDMVK